MKRIISMIAVCLLLISCQNKTHYLDSFGKAETAVEMAVSVPEANSPSHYDRAEKEDNLKMVGNNRVIEKVPAQIIRNANVQFQVSNVEASHHKISGLLKQFNAYYASDNKTTNTYQLNQSMIIRVPASGFENLMDELMKESVYTNYKNISAEDVTAEFVDIQARLKTKKEVELRYIALLKQSNKVTDILEVEDKLRVIREEIEAAEGRMKLLKDQVGYSTITLDIYQKLDYTPEPEIGFFSNLKAAFVKGWRSLVNLCIMVVRIWPFALMWLVAMIFIYKKFMKWK
ncbi:MAG: DUF4349 domain-containing protein [Bacteroidota bacterium]